MTTVLKSEELMSAALTNVFVETVTEVKHYTDFLFKFRLTRPNSLRFRSGEFVMIGLMIGDKPVYRAYSITSPSWEEELEFFSIKVPDGPLTSHLQNIEVGDRILIKQKATGTLVNDALIPGRVLYMFSTGTGIAPFASLIRDPETYEKFETLVLTHTCREIAELKYGEEVVEAAKKDPLIGEHAQKQLKYYASVTRENFEHTGRITDLIETGQLFDDLELSPLNPESDRVMICGSIGMIKDTKQLVEAAGLNEGTNNRPAEFVVERSFVG